MFFISSRIQLQDSAQVSPNDEFWDVRIRQEMSKSQKKLDDITKIQDAVSKKKVLIIVHGYNNSFDDVVRAYGVIEGKIKQHLPGVYDEVIGYTWPGGDQRFDYFSAKTRSGAVAPRFCNNLRQLTAKPANRPAAIDVMTHSMGSRLALEALKYLNKKNVVRNLFLMASAIDNESLEKGYEYHASARWARNAIVFHSRHDDVLKVAYRIAEFDSALGQNGPEDPGSIMKHSPGTFVVNCKNHIRRHGDYKSTDAVYKYLAGNLPKVSAPQFSTL